MTALWIWMQFLALALAIGFAGYHLCFYADRIAERTRLGRNWIGLILLATITSLPELMSGISAVASAGTLDLAVGDVLGSCVFNLALVFLLDFTFRESSVYSKATQGHILSAALGIILLSFVAFGLTIAKRFLGFGIGHLGGFTLTVPFFYLLAMRTLYGFELKNRPRQDTAEVQAEARLLPDSRIYAFFALAAVVVIAAGVALPFVGGRIMTVMGWNEAFVGTLFIAMATSLPEIAVTISAVRLRAIELAFSNLLGSNLFNIVVLFVDDAFYTKGRIFHEVSGTHAVTAISAVMMTGLVLVGLIQAPRRRLFNTVSGMSLLLVLAYLLNAYIVFEMGG